MFKEGKAFVPEAKVCHEACRDICTRVLVALDFFLRMLLVAPNPIKELGTGGEKGKGKREKGGNASVRDEIRGFIQLIN